jgi:hypothetical protein
VHHIQHQGPSPGLTSNMIFFLHTNHLVSLGSSSAFLTRTAADGARRRQIEKIFTAARRRPNGEAGSGRSVRSVVVWLRTRCRTAPPEIKPWRRRRRLEDRIAPSRRRRLSDRENNCRELYRTLVKGAVRRTYTYTILSRPITTVP